MYNKKIVECFAQLLAAVIPCNPTVRLAERLTELGRRGFQLLQLNHRRAGSLTPHVQATVSFPLSHLLLLFVCVNRQLPWILLTIYFPSILPACSNFVTGVKHVAFALACVIEVLFEQITGPTDF